MKDYWLTQHLLNATGIGFLLVCLLAITLAIWLPKTRRGKGIALAAVLIALLVPASQIYVRAQARERAAVDFRQRYEAAKAHFDERCKTAGEKIYKTVEEVEGFAIEKLRPESLNLQDQYQLDDPYGQAGNGRGEAYVRNFLRGRESEFGLTDKHTRGAYQFVDLLSGDGGATRYRTTGQPTGESITSAIEKAQVTESSIFLVRWRDASERVDRDHWVACGEVKVLNRQTGELLGERMGCMFDHELGSNYGGRSPWGYARNQSCPEPRRTADGRAYRDAVDRNFVEKVLTPLQGE